MRPATWLFLIVLVLFSGTSTRAQFVPGGIDTTSSTRIVDDTIAFLHDPDGDTVPDAQLGNWEPYTSVLGNSVFLIESNIFATSEDVFAREQNYGIVFQPAAGGAPSRGHVFHADDGTPFTGKINESRPNGNPGRVAGDKRPGATGLIAGGEANPHFYPEFQSDTRWDTGVVRDTAEGAPGRYASVQLYGLNAATLCQTPASKAFDAIHGRLTSGDAVAGAGDQQIGRFGGELAGLSDGNFVAVVDDRSMLHAVGRNATAVIVAPDGTIVKDTFVIGPGEIWSNVCAFKGGFCVRLTGLLKFYNNAGDFQGEVDQDVARILAPDLTVLFAFDRNRGDGTRVVSHINSNHVFLAGRNNEPVQDVRLAVWDARDRSFKGSINVNELSAADGGTDAETFRPTLDRVNAAADALNRVVVTYEAQPAGYAAPQVVARVLAFDATDNSLEYLTPSFFPFINNYDACPGVGLPIRSFRPSPSMTTREILIAAKGEPNSENLPENCSDFPGETNFYTVITHPDPQEDPTPPVSPLFIPGDIASVALTRIVDDTIAFFHDPDGDTIRDAQLGNWEPYTSVLGNSVFLIESNIFATSEDVFARDQNYGIVFQPAAGGAPSRGHAFHADDGTPFTGKINESRPNGNPGRVAGDKRPGATGLIAGGEANPHFYPEFQSDTRWETGVVRDTAEGAPGRYGAVQTYCYDAAGMTQQPRSKAFDAIHGRLTSGDAVAGAGDQQVGRFGGELAGLSDGNFVVVVDDRSMLHAAGRNATAVIVAPDGTIVKDTFVIGSGEIWSNVCAFKGGFCVRLGGLLKFYNNAGVFQGEVDQDTAKITDCRGGTVFAFDRGRGDGHRIASHINSNHVFLAGRNNEPVQDVRLAVWDARDRSFKGSINVNELTPAQGGTDTAVFRVPFDRINLAVDALNRVVVTFEVQPAGFAAQQVAARVLAFNEADNKLSYLTSSFFPFINSIDACVGAGLPIRSYRPSPSMTTRQILIAAKGEPNSDNLPENCSDVPGETNFYTVISHPDPKDDPTPAVVDPCGTAGGRQKPQDMNQDGRHDISDTIAYLAYLFQGGGAPPCGDQSKTHPANVRLLDCNGDARLDISDALCTLGFLFQGTQRPALCLDNSCPCVQIAECPDRPNCP